MDAIQPGASFAQIIDKINEVVQYVNTKEQTQISYNDLQNKPRIDTIELTESTEMKDLRIDLAQFPNIAQLEEMVSLVAGNMAAQTAETVAAQKVQTELGIQDAKSAGLQPQDNFKIFIFAKNEDNQEIRYSLSLDELAEYVNVYLSTQRTVVGG